MCFFNKLKTKDIYNYLDAEWKVVDLPELPPKRERNYDTFATTHEYNTLKKDTMAYFIKLKKGRWNIGYNAYYNKKDKSMHFCVNYYNLTITNTETQKNVRETFKDYKFEMGLSFVTVNTKYYKVKNMDDVKSVFYTFINDWKNSGLYGIFDKFITNEELKAKNGK
jgi:hypothetical protein